MISKILHWNKKWWALILLFFIFLMFAIFSYNSYLSRKKYEEQAVMAQEYLETGIYEEAIEAYEKAMSMKYGDREHLSIGLAEAYAGVNNYDKALEVLRSRYQVKKTTTVKEKIEEITARKADYNFYQLISYGDTYFANGEYDKAIDEYEKAKLIKSKEEISYIKIVNSYIAMDKFDLAKEEIQEGLALTESIILEAKLTFVDSRIKEIKYDEILNKASEYIYQENYEEAINRLNEAIWLIPSRDTAYNQMAELYITLKEYDTAKALLQNYLRSNKSQAAQELLSKTIDLIAQREEKERILNELYTALNVVDIETIISIMKDSFFVDTIASMAPFYYSPSGNMNMSLGYGMLISDAKDIYAGGFKNEMKEGIGIQFIMNEESGWYYYQGEWSHNMPNGMGKIGEEVLVKDKEGNKQRLATKTSGIFSYGMENGVMQKIFFVDNEEKGRVSYMAVDGIPKAYVDENGQTPEADIPEHYVIGRIYLDNEPTGEYYSIKTGTKFTVKLGREE